MVAIKRCFSSGSSLDRKDLSRQFESEIKLLLRLHHKNIVKLLGYCIERGERILVYEYVPNGGLGKFIFGIFLLMLIIVCLISILRQFIFLCFIFYAFLVQEQGYRSTGHCASI